MPIPILEFKDYKEIQLAYHTIDEWFLPRLGEFFRKKLFLLVGKNYTRKMNELIAPPIVDKMVDQKKAELSGEVITIEDIEDITKSIDDIFKTIKEEITKGKFFLLSIKALEEQLKIADNEYQMGTSIDTLKKTTGETDEVKIKEKLVSAVAERGKQFKSILTTKLPVVQKIVETEIDALLKEIGKKKLPYLKAAVEKRFANTRLVLFLIEFEFAKRRYSLEDISKLQDNVVDNYKESLQMNKNLTDKLKEAGAEVEDVELEALNKIKENFKIEDIIEDFGRKKGGTFDYIKIKSIESEESPGEMTLIVVNKEGNSISTQFTMKYTTFLERLPEDEKYKEFKTEVKKTEE